MSAAAAARAQESNTEWLIGVMGTFCALAVATVSLRIYARVALLKTAGWDDYIMVSSALLTVTGFTLSCLQIQYGLGKHTEFYTPQQKVEYQKLSFFISILANTGGVAVLKISIGLSLLKLSLNSTYNWIIRGFLGFTTFTFIFAWSTIISYCNPVSGYWDKSIKPQCYPLKLYITFGLVHTAMNVFTDIAFATLPIPVIWMLQMRKRTKVYLIGAFSLGWVAVAMGIPKAVYQINFGSDPDRQFKQGVPFWAALQLNTGIIAACAPTLKPLVGRALHLNSTSYGRGYGSRDNRSGGTGGPSRGVGMHYHRRSKRAGYHIETEIPDDHDQEDNAMELGERCGIARSGPTTTITANTGRAYINGRSPLRAATDDGDVQKEEASSEVTVYDGVGADAGSEEIILQRQQMGIATTTPGPTAVTTVPGGASMRNTNQGILRTTEIHIQR